MLNGLPWDQASFGWSALGKGKKKSHMYEEICSKNQHRRFPFYIHNLTLNCFGFCSFHKMSGGLFIALRCMLGFHWCSWLEERQHEFNVCKRMPKVKSTKRLCDCNRPNDFKFASLVYITSREQYTVLLRYLALYPRLAKTRYSYSEHWIQQHSGFRHSCFQRKPGPSGSLRIAHASMNHKKYYQESKLSCRHQKLLNLCWDCWESESFFWTERSIHFNNFSSVDLALEALISDWLLPGRCQCHRLKLRQRLDW